MKDQDLQRLGDYIGAPGHAFQPIKRAELHSDALTRWPVLADADVQLGQVVDAHVADDRSEQRL